MSSWTDMENDFRTWVNHDGLQVSIKHRSLTFHAGSHDEGIMAESGTAITGSAFLQPLSYSTGQDDAQFLSDGTITLSDRKMFLPSGLNIVSGASVVIDSGSYDALGIRYVPNKEQIVYQKVWLRTQKVD